MSVIGYFDPVKAPEFKKAGTVQIGHYNAAESAERSTLIGDGPILAGYSVFANYLSVQGKLGKIGDYLKTNPFDPSQLEQVTLF